MNIFGQIQLYMRTPQSKISLQRRLREDGYSADEAARAVRWLHGDWPRQALAEAGRLAQTVPPVSRKYLRENLQSQGFLPAEIDFAMAALPVSWHDRARETVIPDNEDKAQYLGSQDYTDNEILWALGVRPSDEEEAAWQQAACLLSRGPSSKAVFRAALAQSMADTQADAVLERLGDIWAVQAHRSALHLLGRYGALLSKKRLMQFLQAEKYTLAEIAAVLRDLDTDWEEQALQCALYYFRTQNYPVRKLKGVLKKNLFTSQEICGALEQLEKLEENF